MRWIGKPTLLTAAMCMAAAITLPATAQHTDEEVMQRIADLEREVARLRVAAGEDHITEARAIEIRRLVEDVLADADTRASLLDNSLSAGWDNGFYLRSADGNYRLNVNGQMQFRYIYNYQSNPSDIPIFDDDGDLIGTTKGDRHRRGFENTRTQIIFSGNVVNPNWIYRVQGNYLRSGGRFELEEAYLGHAFDNGWTFLAGQFRVPMLREFLVVEMRQQAVERSLVHQEFTAGRTQGVALDYRDDNIHLTFGYTDGHPATGGFNSPALARSTEFALTARGEWLAAGTWGQFNDFAGWKDDEFGLLVGGAVHYQKGEYGTADPKLEVFQWTVDVSAEFGGANLFAYIVGRHLDDQTDSLDQYGFVVQGGYFLRDDLELFGRYEWGDDDLGGKNLSLITVGANYYIHKHQLKWSTDLGFGLREVSSTWGSGYIGSGGDLAGWRTDAPGKKRQMVLRTQLQLLF